MRDIPEEWRRVYDLIAVVETQIRPEYATLSHLSTEADRLVSLHPTSAEARYLRALALYDRWDYHNGDVDEAAQEMHAVLHMEPYHQWACWHAIVLSYTLGDHDSVLELFARVNREYFAKDHKDWRFVKAWEYALCSRLRTGRLKAFEGELDELIDAFVKVADDPDEGLERPNQLLAIYRELRSGALRELLERQLARLVPGGWIEPEELAEVS
ncbi:hypothetical protein AB0J80_27930 [Actinoplanes sp. NPDC049548]|uniref:hypothetical protein n=1 Tax=Actinoplanes sp. NPDC049548 TaxID=3155152 RepID=UPI003447A250